MTTYGVTPEGFVVKPLNTILSEVGKKEQEQIDPSLDLSPTGPIGQINGIYAAEANELWLQLQAVYASRFPQSAKGAALDNVCDITGVVRLDPAPSTVMIDLNLEPDAIVHVDDEVSIGPLGKRFKIKTETHNTNAYDDTFTVLAECTETGPIAAYAGFINTIQTPRTGWLNNLTAKSDVAGPYNLNGLTLAIGVKYDGSIPDIEVLFTGANPWSVDSIVTAINDVASDHITATNAGGFVRLQLDTNNGADMIRIDSFSELFSEPVLVRGFNREDATLGRNLETDPELRVRRLLDLNGLGAGTLEAIIAAVTAVDDVTHVNGYHNTSKMPDALGIPGHHYHIIALGGTDQDIARAIWLAGPAGIKTYGTTLVEVEDSQGVMQPIRFSRPRVVELWVDTTVLTDPELFVEDEEAGKALIKEAILSIGRQLQVDDDIFIKRFEAACITVKGVDDVLTMYIDTHIVPNQDQNIPIDYMSIAEFDSSRINVTVL